MCDGFIVDNGDGLLKLAAAWHPGEVVASFWCGVKVQHGKQRRITAYRCDQCGFVEMYAP